MQELIDQAIIIVLVSHDMSSIRRICSRAIYLRAGKLLADRDVDHLMREYIA
jgi:ABC-type polysaccharide/polyol phosphate transport system ATPase subunit